MAVCSVNNTVVLIRSYVAELVPRELILETVLSHIPFLFMKYICKVRCKIRDSLILRL